MRLVLTRKTFTDKSTIGELTVDGAFQCFTLEDVPREKKIAGKTAIPAGTYKLIINHSPRFKRDLPRLLEVPGFEGILIHPGNKAEDTEGCILVGKTEGKDFIGSSRDAFEALFAKLRKALDGGEAVSIEVQ